MIKVIPPSQSYMEGVFEVIKNDDDITNLKIIVPTIFSCINLQRIIVKNSKNAACLLPQIVPLVNIGVGSEGVYTIPRESVEPISYLEQKIIISELVRKELVDISVSQSLDFANHIIRLFDEFLLYGVSLEDLYDISVINDAQHWQYMLGFLSKIYSSWYKIQDDLGQVDIATYRQNILKMTIESADSGCKIIIAGIIPRGKLLKDLAHVIAESKKNILILPHISAYFSDDVSVTSKFLVGKICSEWIDEFQLPENFESHKNITICTLNSLFEEASHIAMKSKEYIDSGASNVAIVTQNDDLILMLESLFNFDQISHININGYKIAKTKQYEFFILLIKAFDSVCGLNLENMLALFKTHYLFSEQVVELEYKLRKLKINTDQELILFLRDLPDDVLNDKILLIFKNISLFSAHDGFIKSDVCQILRKHISLAESLVPNIWSSEEGEVFAELLYDILQIDDLPICNIQEYLEFVENIISGARYFASFQNQDILFMNLEEASLGGYKHIICCDMNEGSIPLSLPYDPWMNTQMRLSVGLPDASENIGIQWYYFNNLLSRPNLYLTRANRVAGKLQIPSRFLRELDLESSVCFNMSDFSHGMIPASAGMTAALSRFEGDCCEYLSHQNENLENAFPQKISATNLELLIRNPYGFYAKYILELRKLDNVFEENRLSKFGNFLHNVIEKYTKAYSEDINDKYDFIINIGTDVAKEYNQSHINLWWPKFLGVMKEFIIFDEQRRMDGRKIFAEIYGEMPIDINGKIIHITAIADRIEQDNDGNVYILDYKTGTLPTKQDVLSGIAVQMLAEAMIVDSNGFAEVSGKICELSYVKIASRWPYIEVVTYEVSSIDLESHKEGLKKILSYYLGGNFDVNTNPKFAPKYDDYVHLARKI